MVGVGPAVRLVPYLHQQPKSYRAVFRLGCSSDSLDLEGELQNHPEDPQPTRDQLNDAAGQFVGIIQQIPPAHSAIWVDGKRAYARVRAGESVEMPSRTVQIDSVNIERYDYPEFEFETVCGSGTYIRTLGCDIATRAGARAVMSHLRRTSVGPFEASESISLERLRDDDISTMLVPAVAAVGHLGHVEIDEGQSIRLGHGICLETDLDHSPDTSVPSDSSVVAEAAAITTDGQLRAILKRKRGAWCPHRVFPLS